MLACRENYFLSVLLYYLCLPYPINCLPIDKQQKEHVVSIIIMLEELCIKYDKNTIIPPDRQPKMTIFVNVLGMKPCFHPSSFLRISLYSPYQPLYFVSNSYDSNQDPQLMVIIRNKSKNFFPIRGLMGEPLAIDRYEPGDPHSYG